MKICKTGMTASGTLKPRMGSTRFFLLVLLPLAFSQRPLVLELPNLRVVIVGAIRKESHVKFFNQRVIPGSLWVTLRFLIRGSFLAACGSSDIL